MSNVNFVKVGLITVGILVGIAMVGATLLHVIRPDASATFIQQMSTLIGLVTTAAGIFYGFQKQSERLDGIEKNTNGRLSARDERIRELERLALDNGIDPQTGQPITGPTDTQA